jgi:hypothetical protein
MTTSSAPANRTLRPDNFKTEDGKATGKLVTPFMRDVGNLFEGGISWQNMRCVERELTFTMPSLFVTATLTAPWAAESGYSAPGYSKGADGVVRLRGACDGGTYSGTAIFTLPSAYWPVAAVSFPAVQNNATFTPTGQVDISAAGVVTAPDIPAMQTGVSTRLCFDGMTFDTTDPNPVVVSPFPVFVNITDLGASAKDVLVTYCYDATSPSLVPWPSPRLAWGNSTYSGIPMVSVSQALGCIEGRRYRVGLKIFA